MTLDSTVAALDTNVLETAYAVDFYSLILSCPTAANSLPSGEKVRLLGTVLFYRDNTFSSTFFITHSHMHTLIHSHTLNCSFY